jgi:hypothetical protein
MNTKPFTKRILPLLLTLTLVLSLFPPLTAFAVAPTLTSRASRGVYGGSGGMVAHDTKATITINYGITDSNVAGNYWYIAATSAPTFPGPDSVDGSGWIAETFSGNINGVFTFGLTDSGVGGNVYVVVQPTSGEKTDVSEVCEVVVPPYDGVAPSVTPGEVNRTGDTAATVKFTSDETGFYQYIVQESGASAPTNESAFNTLMASLQGGEGAGSYAGAGTDHDEMYYFNNNTYLGFALAEGENTIAVPAALLSATAKQITIMVYDYQYNASVHTIVIPAAFATPAVTATAGDGQVKIDWTVSSDGGSAITGYQVGYYIAPAGALAIDNVSDSVSTYTFTGLTNGTAYIFEVMAIHGTDGSATGTVSATPNVANAAAQAPVINTQPQGGTVTLNGSITLSVAATSPDGGTLSYQWYKVTGSEPYILSEIITTATNATYNPPTNAAGASNYRVIVTNTKSGTTATTNSNVVTVTVKAPPTLTYIGFDRTSHTAAVLSFISTEAGTYYYLIRETSAAAPTAAQIKAGGVSGTMAAINSFPVTLTQGAKNIYVIVP